MKIGDWVRWNKTAPTTAAIMVEAGTVGQIDNMQYGLRVKIGPGRWRHPHREDIDVIDPPPGATP